MPSMFGFKLFDWPWDRNKSHTSAPAETTASLYDAKSIFPSNRVSSALSQLIAAPTPEAATPEPNTLAEANIDTPNAAAPKNQYDFAPSNNKENDYGGMPDDPPNNSQKLEAKIPSRFKLNNDFRHFNTVTSDNLNRIDRTVTENKHLEAITLIRSMETHIHNYLIDESETLSEAQKNVIKAQQKELAELKKDILTNANKRIDFYLGNEFRETLTATETIKAQLQTMHEELNKAPHGEATRTILNKNADLLKTAQNLADFRESWGAVNRAGTQQEYAARQAQFEKIPGVNASTMSNAAEIKMLCDPDVLQQKVRVAQMQANSSSTSADEKNYGALPYPSITTSSSETSAAASGYEDITTNQTSPHTERRSSSAKTLPTNYVEMPPDFSNTNISRQNTAASSASYNSEHYTSMPNYTATNPHQSAAHAAATDIKSAVTPVENSIERNKQKVDPNNAEDANHSATPSPGTH